MTPPDDPNETRGALPRPPPAPRRLRHAGPNRILGWYSRSGTLFYDYVTSNLYAVVYTALPILLYGTYDQDISAETCLR